MFCGVKTLLRHGANPDLRDEDGKTPLDKARERGHSEVVAILQSPGTFTSAVAAPPPEPLKHNPVIYFHKRLISNDLNNDFTPVCFIILCRQFFVCFCAVELLLSATV